MERHWAMKTRRNLDSMVPLGMTAMEQDIDRRVRAYFSPNNRCLPRSGCCISPLLQDVRLQRRFKSGYAYKPREMVPLYQAYWEDYFEEEQT